MAVGGRNLLRATANPASYRNFFSWGKVTKGGDFVRLVSDTAKNNGLFNGIKSTHTIQSGVDYVVSFAYRTNAPNLAYTFVLADSGNLGLGQPANFVNDETWQNAVIARTAPRDLTNVRLLVGCVNMPVGTYIEVKYFKIEIGTIPTDWTPAPEDIQSQLDTKASTASLDEFKQAQASKEQATAQRINTLDTAYKQADSQMTARMAREEQARASADTALGQRIDSLQSEFNGNKSSLANQLKTLSDKDKAQAQKLSQLESSLGQKASATALNQTNTKVGQIEGRITAEASKYNTLQTAVNNHTASIQVMMRSVDGLKSQWTVKVESGGIVAGIGLASSNGKSRFAIRADVVDIVAPDGTRRPMFSVLTKATTINGVSVPKGVYMDTAYIANGSIDIAKINKASIQNLSAISANIGHFKSAPTGARLEIKDSVLLVYDDNNRLRVRLGVW